MPKSKRKKLRRSIVMAVAMLISAIGFNIQGGVVHALPTQCYPAFIGNTAGQNICYGGTGEHRVKIWCFMWTSSGTTITEIRYGPWVGVGAASFRSCSSGYRIDTVSQNRR